MRNRKITTILLAVLLFAVSQGALAQQRTITGRVINDQDGQGIPGASVVLKGTTIGTTTDSEGNFSINVWSGATIVVSYMGFKTVEMEVENRTQFGIMLQAGTNVLDDVIVTARRSQRGITIPPHTVVAQVQGEELIKSSALNIPLALTGKIAGYTSTIRHRGEAGPVETITLFRGKSPLWVIDGIQSNYGQVLQLSVDDIENVIVLYGINAGVPFGIPGRGVVGIIAIYTKRF